MHAVLLTVHVTTAAIMVGVLFVQCLALAMAARLPSEVQRAAVRSVQERVQAWVYYPLLALAVLSGLWIALADGTFSSGRWLHWKVLGVVLLVGVGLLVGGAIRAPRPSRASGRILAVAVLILSAAIFYLAVLQPF